MNSRRTNWRMVKFGDVVKNVAEVERDPLGAGLERLIGLDDIEPGNLHIKTWGQVADGTSFSRRFRKGQVLFAKRRAYQRKVAVAEFDGICSSDMLTFEPKGDDLLPELLPFIVQSDGFFGHALDTSAGSLSPRTRWSQLKTYEFPLPPEDEQRRIAEILWAADETLQRFACLPARVIELKEAAFRHFIGLPDPKDLRTFISGRCSKTRAGWDIQEIAAVVTQGRQGVQVGPFGGSICSRHFQETGVPVLKINNITDNGGLDTSELVYVSEEHAAGLARYKVEAGDLVTASQATTDRSALVAADCAGALISQHLIRVSVDPKICLPRYLLACFQSPLILKQIDSVKAKSTRDGFNTGDVEKFRIPVPPRDRQRSIVSALDMFDTVFGTMTSHFDQVRTAACRIRDRLLANGFC